VLARWTRSGEEGQADQLQAYFDGATLNEPVGQYKRRTLDVDAQHHAIFGRRHDVIVGGGYRFIDETYLGLAGYSVSRPAANEHLVNAFGQDEIAMAANRVRVSVGAKVEYDTYVGGGIQPTGRVIWDLRPRQHVWAAASRALRTPSLIDHSFRLTFGPTLGYAGGLPIIAGVVGNPDFHSETLADVETGYRIDLGTMATLDVAGFVSAYQGLEVQTPIAPRLELSPTPHILAGATMTNGMEADTRGLEIAFRAQPLAPWRFDATYSAYRMTSALDPGVVLARQVPIDGNAPRAQWRIGSSYAIGTIGDLNAQLFHVGRLEAIGIAPYTRMDLRVNLRMGSHFTASFGGQNLLQATHAEFTGQSGNTIGTLVPRSGGMQLTWRQ
jgi:iron complex outermembrane receptor protein